MNNLPSNILFALQQELLEEIQDSKKEFLEWLKEPESGNINRINAILLQIRSVFYLLEQSQLLDLISNLQKTLLLLQELPLEPKNNELSSAISVAVCKGILCLETLSQDKGFFAKIPESNISAVSEELQSFLDNKPLKLKSQPIVTKVMVKHIGDQLAVDVESAKILFESYLQIPKDQLAKRSLLDILQRIFQVSEFIKWNNLSSLVKNLIEDITQDNLQQFGIDLVRKIILLEEIVATMRILEMPANFSKLPANRIIFQTFQARKVFRQVGIVATRELTAIEAKFTNTEQQQSIHTLVLFLAKYSVVLSFIKEKEISQRLEQFYSALLFCLYNDQDVLEKQNILASIVVACSSLFSDYQEFYRGNILTSKFLDSLYQKWAVHYPATNDTKDQLAQLQMSLPEDLQTSEELDNSLAIALQNIESLGIFAKHPKKVDSKNHLRVDNTVFEGESLSNEPDSSNISLINSTAKNSSQHIWLEQVIAAKSFTAIKDSYAELQIPEAEKKLAVQENNLFKDSDIRSVFIDELNEKFEEIKANIANFSQCLADSEKVKVIRRAFHTIKGSGRIVGLQALGEFAAQAENLLNQFLNNKFENNPLFCQMIEDAFDLLGYQLGLIPFKEAKGVLLTNALILQKANDFLVDNKALNQSTLDLFWQSLPEMFEHAAYELINENIESPKDDIQSQEIPIESADSAFSLDANNAVFNQVAPVQNNEITIVKSTNNPSFDFDITDREVETSVSSSSEINAPSPIPPISMETSNLTDTPVDSLGVEKNEEKLLDAQSISAPAAFSLDSNSKKDNIDSLQISNHEDSSRIDTSEKPKILEKTDFENTLSLAMSENTANTITLPSDDGAELLNGTPDAGNVESEVSLEAIITTGQPNIYTDMQGDLSVLSESDYSNETPVRNSFLESVTEVETQNSELQAVIESYIAKLSKAIHLVVSNAEYDATDEDMLVKFANNMFIDVLQEEAVMVITQQLKSEFLEHKDLINKIINKLKNNSIHLPKKHDENHIDSEYVVFRNENKIESNLAKDHNLENAENGNDLSELSSQFFDTTLPATIESEKSSNSSLAVSDSSQESKERIEDKAVSSITDSKDDDEILSVFLDESRKLLAQQADLLNQDLANEKVLNESKRAMHTLKGGAHLINANFLANMAHAVENVLNLFLESNASEKEKAKELLFTAYEEMQGLVDNLARGDEQEYTSFTLITEQLANFRSSKRSATSEYSENSSLAPIHQDIQHTDVVQSKLTADTLVSEKQNDWLNNSPVNHFVRVETPLLSHLINQVSESAVICSRIEVLGKQSSFGLDELSEIAARITMQLRYITDIIEIQIKSRRDESIQDENEDFDPLEMDRYSEVQTQARILAESVEDLKSIQSSLSDDNLALRNFIIKQVQIQRDIHDQLMITQLERFDSIASRLKRLVKQTAQTLGKEVELIINGGSIELERRIIEEMTPAIEHLLRNAIDHGIELPEVRTKLGKSRTGTIEISLRNEASNLRIFVIDDGQGLNYDAIRYKAIENGALAENAEVSNLQLKNLLLNSGFSTTKEISQISGRGVGLDVVNEIVKEHRGQLIIESEESQGSQFILDLPQSMSLIDVIMISIAGKQYAVLLNSITAIFPVLAEDVKKSAAGETIYLDYHQRKARLQVLGKYFDSQFELEILEQNQLTVLIVEISGELLALYADEIGTRHEVVLKNVNRQIFNLPGISGAIILGNGEVVPVLDMYNLGKELYHLEFAKEDIRTEISKSTVMVVDDSVTMRKISSALLQRNGYQVITAKDGLDAIVQLKEYTPSIILLDIEMPRMDGYEFAKYFRSQKKYDDIPIIMITSRTGEKHHVRAQSIGIQGYVGKPYQEAELIKTLKESLRNG